MNEGWPNTLVAAQGPERQTVGQLATLWKVQHATARSTARLLREELRLLYDVDDAALAPAHLDA